MSNRLLFEQRIHNNSSNSHNNSHNNNSHSSNSYHVSSRHIVSEPKYKFPSMIDNNEYNDNRDYINRDRYNNRILVSKPGRIPYYQNDIKVAFRDHRDTPNGYVSIQSKINTGPDGTVDLIKLKKYLDHKKFQKIDHFNFKELHSLVPGIRIAYITKDRKWRSGGFLVSLNRSSNDSKIFILYKGFSHTIYSLQIEDILGLYGIHKKRKVVIVNNSNKSRYVKKGEKPILFNKLTYETNFPVYLHNYKGKEEIVHYAKDNDGKRRFMATNKYQRALMTKNWAFNNENLVEVSDYEDESYNISENDNEDDNEDSGDSESVSDNETIISSITESVGFSDSSENEEYE